jgi:transcriptional regulator with XRE-family HTH domain
MTIFQTQLLNELGAGPDGKPISQSKLVYLQERLRGRFFDFLISSFEDARERGLTQAKLARRIRKSPEVVNRLLSAPTNLTLDSISDLLAGINAEELNFAASSFLDRPPVNQWHLDDAPSAAESMGACMQQKSEGSVLGGEKRGASAQENAMR